MDWWYDALGIVFHLTVNKYFAERIYGISCIMSLLKHPFLLYPKRHRHRCSHFQYVKHSGFYHPADFDPESLQMQQQQQQRFG